MKHLEGNGHILTWAALAAMLATAVTFYESAHEHFAQQTDIEGLRHDVDKCVTHDELTIALLKHHGE